MDTRIYCYDIKISLDYNLMIHQLVPMLDLNNVQAVVGDLPSHVLYGNQSLFCNRIIHFLNSSETIRKLSAIQKIVEACDSQSTKQPEQLPLLIQYSPLKPLFVSSNETHFAHGQPFFKVINTIVTPTRIPGFTSCTSLHWIFNGLKIIKDMIEKFKFKIILRLEPSGLKSFNGNLPNDVEVFVNNHKAELPELNYPETTSGSNFVPFRSCDPIDITEQIILNKHDVEDLKISWSNEPCDYTVGVYLVKKLTWETLLVELKKKPLHNSEKTKEQIRRSMQREAALGLDYMITSIIDSKTSLRMKVPTRGNECIHLRCFDAIPFLQRNYQKQTWECPLCMKHVKFETMKIDEYYLNIVQSPNLSKECEFLVLSRNGSWTEKKPMNFQKYKQ